ncbi:MAG: hypothetical protein UW75_C0048G0010, partial [Parcubacteria group bacterium GW2011_GWF2_44_8]
HYTTEILPNIAAGFVGGGIELIGRSLGLDPRITALIGLPVSASVGWLFGHNQMVIGYRDDGTPIYVTGPYNNGKGLWETIQDSIINQGAKAIGFDFHGATTHPLFGSLGSGNILASIESTLQKEGLFSGIFSLLGKALLTPFNAIESVVRSILSGVTNFSDLIREKGIINAFESLVTSIFNRKTIEQLLGSGGVGGLISSAAKVSKSS